MYVIYPPYRMVGRYFLFLEKYKEICSDDIEFRIQNML